MMDGTDVGPAPALTDDFLGLLLLCARLSQAAYELDDAKRQALVIAAGAEELNYVTGRDDARMLVAREAKIGIIWAFQGTQFTKGELPSIIENLRDDPVDLVGGRQVMHGYWDQLQALTPHFADLPPADLVTGHSMGGTIAELSQIGDMAPITFGAPKCANATFWSTARFQPLRIVRASDFAPNWPDLESEFVQPGPDLWLHQGAAGMTLEAVASRPGINQSVEDHTAELYIDDLAALILQKRA